MSSSMLQAVWPEELAARGEELRDSVPLGAAGRLREFVRRSLAAGSVAAPEGWEARPVSVELRFEIRRTQGNLSIPAVTGKACVCLPLACDRCLGLVEFEAAADIALLLPDSEIAEDALPGFDVWVVDERGLRPLDLVEEELLLSLPLASMHSDRRECELRIGEFAAGDADRKTQRPFSVLKALMEGDDKQEG